DPDLADRAQPARAVTSASPHEQRPQRALGDLETELDLVLGAAPHRILVLDREHAVEAALVQRVDQAHPVDLPQASHAVAPPADVPWIAALERLAVDAPAVS